VEWAGRRDGRAAVGGQQQRVDEVFVPGADKAARDSRDDLRHEPAEIVPSEQTVVTLGLVAAPRSLRELAIRGRGQQDSPALLQRKDQRPRFRAGEVLEHIVAENQVVGAKSGQQVTDVTGQDPVVGEVPDRIAIGFEKFHTLNRHLPRAFLDTTIPDIQTLPQQKPVAARADADIEDRPRTAGLDEVQDRGDVFGVAQGHGERRRSVVTPRGNRLPAHRRRGRPRHAG
jgi:hypothetical protein